MSVPVTVSLVIPLYNQVEYTRRCIESIERCTQAPYELILIDNASTDGTREYVNQVKATVITNATNLGCAKAWNQGVRAATGTVIAILNNDIVVTPGWLKGLMDFMERGGYGIVSPAAREGPLNYALDDYAREFTHSCGAATRSAIYGACMVIHRRVFDRIGLFDEGFHYGGCEDIDFLWRTRAAGFSVATTGSVLIHHFSMVTQDAVKRSETKSYPLENLAHFQKKWGRTVRGSWAERRLDYLKSVCVNRFERVCYGHTLIEKKYE